jgi:hypothetical protein
MSLNALNVCMLLNFFTMSKVFWRNKKYGGYKKRSESWQKNQNYLFRILRNTNLFLNFVT